VESVSSNVCAFLRGLIGLKAASNREWLRLLDPVDTIFNLVFFFSGAYVSHTDNQKGAEFSFFTDFFLSDIFSFIRSKNRIPRALKQRPSVERVRSENALGQRDVELWPRLGL